MSTQFDRSLVILSPTWSRVLCPWWVSRAADAAVSGRPRSGEGRGPSWLAAWPISRPPWLAGSARPGPARPRPARTGTGREPPPPLEMSLSTVSSPAYSNLQDVWLLMEVSRREKWSIFVIPTMMHSAHVILKRYERMFIEEVHIYILFFLNGTSHKSLTSHIPSLCDTSPRQRIIIT